VEQNDPSYVPRLADVHKLCMLVFEPMNIFSDMNISPEKHKKTEERIPISCSVLFLLFQAKISLIVSGYLRSRKRLMALLIAIKRD
jgi:hypothetical protein